LLAGDGALLPVRCCQPTSQKSFAHLLLLSGRFSSPSATSWQNQDHKKPFVCGRKEMAKL
jgi:hypothetical protein